MRATNAASAALTLALSGSLAAGLAGPAAAATDNAPTAPSSSRGATSAHHDTDHIHVLQIRALGGLGRLSDLTGSTVQNDDVEMSREQRQQLDSQLRRVRDAVARARTARTLPATGEVQQRRSTKVVHITGATEGFQTSVQRLADRPRDDAKARTAASKALLGQLEAVNTAAMKDLGLVAEQSGSEKSSPRSADGASPRSAVTTTLIDRQTLSSDRLERYDGLVDEVGDLLEDVQESPGGRLSREDSAEHAEDVQEALAELRLRGGNRDGAALTALEDRAEALLETSRGGDARQSRAEARRLARETVKLLATAPDGRATSDEDSDLDDLDGADGMDGADGVRLFTGRLLSPLLD
ncbi:hypothetical protein ACFPA8_06935 [Streptomyces ovatisporus]|uniref:Secreted protein n=1 Tax=Streptomyces ovatisporus TaxID=1128682 RepID=A0ABV9A1V0_9ACTN